MVIVADSSVWITYFNKGESPEVDRLEEEALCGNILMGDIILQEVLQGFRSDIEHQRAKNEMLKFPRAGFLGTQNAVRAAHHYRILRKHGITIRKTADTIIATYCIENMIPLLYVDRDFDPFVNHLGLERA
jgi:predicted nucleic acid-binding protein